VFPTLESFFQWLRETFQTHKGLTSQRFSEFLGCQQERGQSVSDYIRELVRLEDAAAMGWTQDKRAKHFYDGLGKRMKKAIQNQWDLGLLPVKPTKWNWKALKKAALKLEEEHPGVSLVSQDRDGMVMPQSAGPRAEVLGVEQQEEQGLTEAECLRQEMKDLLGEQMREMQGMKQQAPVMAVPNPSGNPSTTGGGIRAEVKEMMAQQMEELRALLLVGGPQAPAGGPSCLNCGRVGHTVRECRSRDRRNLVCYSCNQVGHTSLACPNPRRPALSRAVAGPIRCYNCGEAGHLVRNCPHQPGMNVAVTCYACGQPGHYSSQCPARLQKMGTKGVGEMKSQRCYKCNGIGHNARDCKKEEGVPHLNK
jgi:cellular nucleic acid-binding protein